MGHLTRARNLASSTASSHRSSTVLERQAETQRALEGLACTRAECNEQYQALTGEIAAVQKSVQEGLQASDQLRTAQNLQTIRFEAMGHRLGGVNDLLLQRELRMATKIYDLSNE